jgi:beta-lactamase class A
MERSGYILLGASIFSALLIGGAVGYAIHPASASTKILREDGYDLIRPILLCNINGQPQNEDKDLSAKLQAYAGSIKDGAIGVYYANPTLGKWAGANENESFSPASMLKVPIMVAVLRVSEDDPSLLSKKIFYDGSFNDNLLETILPQKALEAGHYYTVDQLLEYMIMYSDNNATHLLHDLLTPQQFEDIYTDLGIEVPAVNGPVDFMSAKTFTLFLRILFNGTYLSHQDSEKALELMTVNDFPQGLKGGIPSTTPIAQKFGERIVSMGENQPTQRELHNCGIVYPDTNGPYLLCVMTRGSDPDALSKEIRDISQIVYQQATK